MKYLPVFIIAFTSLLILTGCSSDNRVSDDSEEIFWHKKDSPILIEGRYKIPVNTTLNIEAGTEIRFSSKTGMLIVQGKIVAEGSIADSIVFTKGDSVDKWGAIVFEETTDPTSFLKYCKIQYSSEVTDYDYPILGAITFLAYSKANIINCNITKNDYGIQSNGYAYPVISETTISHNINGIFSNRCRSLIKNSHIHNNSYNGVYGYGSYATIIDCEIRDNVTGSGIFIEYNSYPEIINNVITNNGYSGINCYEKSSPNIINNLIKNNTEKGILCNYYCTPNIVNNLVTGSIRGIHLANLSDPVVINNTVTDNDYALRLYNKCSPFIINSIIWGNSEVIDPLQDYYYNYDSTPEIFSSLIQGDSLHHSFIDHGGNIIGKDPLFLNSSLNFDLQSGSPCIDNGFNDITELPEYDLAGNPRIVGSSIDIGAYEFQGRR
jgi:parallel beta-helix repeat protein